MMGIPEEDEEKVFHWTTMILGAGDEEVSGDFDEIVKGWPELAEYGMRWPRSVRPIRAMT